MGRDCAKTSCPTGPATNVGVVSNGVTVLVPVGGAGTSLPTTTTAATTGATSAGVVTVAAGAGAGAVSGGGSCAQGWFSCAADVGGGCCPSGYVCGARCTASVSGSQGSVGKIAASGAAEMGRIRMSGFWVVLLVVAFRLV